MKEKHGVVEDKHEHEIRTFLVLWSLHFFLGFFLMTTAIFLCLLLFSLFFFRNMFLVEHRVVMVMTPRRWYY